MKKLFLKRMSICVAILISLFSCNVFAEENSEILAQNFPENNRIVELENSNSSENNHSVYPQNVGYYKHEKVVSSTRRNWVFCGYTVPTWQKASSYSSGKTYSASTTINIHGLSTTVSVSKYASAQIPANSNRFSRLAAYADITFKKVRIEHYHGGQKKPSKVTYRIDKVYHNKYLSVRYK